MTLFNYKPIVMVCSNGFSFVTTSSLTPNTYSFMFTNKYLITTLNTIRLQKEMATRSKIKHSTSSKNLDGLSNT
jgi:hypothetical protein